MLNFKTCNRGDILNFFGKPKDFEIYHEGTGYYLDNKIGSVCMKLTKLYRSGCKGFIYIEYCKQNMPNICCYKKNNNGYYKCNVDGPGFVNFYANQGSICCICYYYNGLLHRPFAPAMTQYDEKGSVVVERFYLKNKCHSSIGPAYRIHSFRYSDWVNFYYLNGKRLSRDEFFERYYKIRA